MVIRITVTRPSAPARYVFIPVDFVPAVWTAVEDLWGAAEAVCAQARKDYETVAGPFDPRLLQAQVLGLFPRMILSPSLLFPEFAALRTIEVRWRSDPFAAGEGRPISTSANEWRLTEFHPSGQVYRLSDHKRAVGYLVEVRRAELPTLASLRHLDDNAARLEIFKAVRAREPHQQKLKDILGAVHRLFGHRLDERPELLLNASDAALRRTLTALNKLS